MTVSTQIDDQVAAVHPPVVPHFAIDAHRRRGQPVTAQQQRHRGVGLAHHRQRRADLRRVDPKREIERDVGDLPVGRAVVAAIDGDGDGGG